MNIVELLKKYRRYEENLNHNIKFHLKEYPENSKMEYIPYLRGQLSIVRELIYDLQGQTEDYYNQDLEYKLGNPI